MTRQLLEGFAILPVLSLITLAVTWGALLDRRVHRLEIIIDGVFSGGNKVEGK